MTTDQIFELLLELNQMVAEELVNTFFNKNEKKTFLIFPKTKNGEIRISEQELRFAMTSLFETNNYRKLSYSVETPTSKAYSFTGKGQRSGSTDLSFYEDNLKILNVELKAKSESQKNIDKDIEKLVNEDCHGAWCQIFINENRGTIEKAFDKLKTALLNKGIPIKPLYFSFLILNTKSKIGKLITRKGLDADLHNFDPDQIINLKYADHKDLPNINTKVGDWQINLY